MHAAVLKMNRNDHDFGKTYTLILEIRIETNKKRKWLQINKQTKKYIVQGRGVYDWLESSRKRPGHERIRGI